MAPATAPAGGKGASRVQFQPSTSLNENVVLPQIDRKPARSGPQRPGSIHAPRLEYGAHDTAFDMTADSEESKRRHTRRVEVQQFKRPRRLGEKPTWNSTTEPPEPVKPRALMHTLSEFQSVKRPHNYRAMDLPDDYKKATFVPKPTKFQVDRKLFLSKEEESRLVDTNVTVNTRTEFGADSESNPQGSKPRWDPSSQMEDDCLKAYYRYKEYADYRALSSIQNEALIGDRYVNPAKREAIRSKKMRQMKMALREKEQEEAERVLDANSLGGTGYTLSMMRRETALQSRQATQASG